LLHTHPESIKVSLITGSAVNVIDYHFHFLP